MMKLNIAAVLTMVFLILGCGKGNHSGAVLVQSGNIAIPQIPGTSMPLDKSAFPDAIPQDGQFIANRVAAAYFVSQQGSEFSDSNENIIASGSAAEFSAESGLAYAIWRFYGTSGDSIGSIQVEASPGESSPGYYVGIADYFNDRWTFPAHAADSGPFHVQLDGHEGEHSSPAGYVYIAVLSEAPADFTIDSVSIEYTSRFRVDGIVADIDGEPLSGALITTNLLDAQQTYSDGQGKFSLEGVPNGIWAALAALEGYQCEPVAKFFIIDGEDYSGLELTMSELSETTVIQDNYEPNDFIGNAHLVGSGPATDVTLSILNDPRDTFEFTVDSPGWKYFEFIGDVSILFPYMEILYDDRDYPLIVAQAGEVVQGANWVGYYFPLAGQYLVEVSCQGGFGSYQLKLNEGKCGELAVSLTDSGESSEGDDLSEKLTISHIRFDFPGYSTVMSPDVNGYLAHRYMPPQPVSITPEASLYQIIPATVQHDFSSSLTLEMDFELVAEAPLDSMEPNNTLESATILDLPLTGPVRGFIGGEELTGYDRKDFFVIDTDYNKHLLLRVSFPDKGPTSFLDNGSIRLISESGKSATSVHFLGKQHLENRYGPLATGTYYVELELKGEITEYELEVIQFTGRNLSIEHRSGNELLTGGLCNWQTSNGYITGRETLYEGQETADFIFMDGESLLVNHEKFGYDIEPENQWITFSGSDILLQPEFTAISDSLEPNNSYDSAADLIIPQLVEASASTWSDIVDIYALPDDYTGNLQVQVTTAEDCRFSFSLISKSPRNPLLDFIGESGDTFYFDMSDEAIINAGYLAISMMDCESSYSLSLQEAAFPVYRLDGTVGMLDEGDSPYGTWIHNHETGTARRLENDSSFLLEYLPNGLYTLEWIISNHIVGPASSVDVLIENADASAEFTASYHYVDVLEPNDTEKSAQQLTDPFSISASLDAYNVFESVNDTVDIYRFQAGNSGIFEVRLTAGVSVHSAPFMAVYAGNTTFSNLVNVSKSETVNGSYVSQLEVISGETYYVEVAAPLLNRRSADLPYSLTGSFIP